ncbi:MAG: hypothetical protein EON58_20495 [Alphaproteobacteria bacterium]|nr:MAG: hypothetical protein EON58_20495 [Alphaproteobacteria bacterium]
MKHWPHAPSHRTEHPGAYMVTGATYEKAHRLTTRARLDAFEQLLLEEIAAAGWSTQAWAVFSNHYHLILHSPDEGGELSLVLKKVHSISARTLNAEDGVVGRKVWYQHRDTQLTYSKSYLARLNYVIQNPVRHGLVEESYRYRWCLARWFEECGDAAWVQTVTSFPTDKVNVADEYDCQLVP